MNFCSYEVICGMSSTSNVPQSFSYFGVHHLNSSGLPILEASNESKVKIII